MARRARSKTRNRRKRSYSRRKRRRSRKRRSRKRRSRSRSVARRVKRRQQRRQGLSDAILPMLIAAVGTSMYHESNKSNNNEKLDAYIGSHINQHNDIAAVLQKHKHEWDNAFVELQADHIKLKNSLQTELQTMRAQPAPVPRFHIQRRAGPRATTTPPPKRRYIARPSGALPDGLDTVGDAASPARQRQRPILGQSLGSSWRSHNAALRGSVAQPLYPIIGQGLHHLASQYAGSVRHGIPTSPSVGMASR